MAEKYKVVKTTRYIAVSTSDCVVALFYTVGIRCPNAEREARNLCRRLNAAAKKGKVKR